MRPRAVSDLVSAAGGAAFRRFGFIQSSVVSRWGEIVGARYAAVSAPESIRFPSGKRAGGTLNLVVEGAHAPLMQHVAPTIIERVNAFFGYAAVERIHVRQGRVAVARTRRPKTAEAPPVPAAMGDSLREIGDPELKAVLESLARAVADSETRKHESDMMTIPVVGKLKR